MNATRWTLTTVCVVMFLGVGFCTIYYPLLPARPPKELDQIQIGMTIDQVTNVFGRPPSAHDDVGRIWRFWHVSNGVVTVAFDDGGRAD